MDGDPATATLEGGLVRADEVLRLLLEFDVRIADQAKHALAGDAETGEEPVQKQTNDVLQHHEPDMTLRHCRQADEPLDLAGQRQQGAHDLAVFFPQQPKRHHQTHVRDERERVRRVDSERG